METEGGLASPKRVSQPVATSPGARKSSEPTRKGKRDVEAIRDPEEFVRQMAKMLGDARNAVELATLGDVLTQRVDSEQERTRKRIANQMAFLRRERDAAQGMRQACEVEVQRLKRQLEVIQTEYKLVDKARVKSLQAQLQAVTTEKQTWMERADKLEDICETLKLVNSLQRSMSKEGEIHREYTAKVQGLQSAIDQQRQKLEMLSFELEKAIQERNTAISDRNATIELLHTEQETTERLSRIVEVLRRKVFVGSSCSSSGGNHALMSNGLGSGGQQPT